MWFIKLSPQVSLKMLLLLDFNKQVFPSIGLLLLAIMNSSLSFGVVPANFKHSSVKPLFKKPDIDQIMFANFMPVTKLPVLSTFVETIVCTHLKSYLEKHDSLDVLQFR